MKFKATDREMVRIRDLYPINKDYMPTKRKMTDEDREWAYKKLRENTKVMTGVEWLLSPEPETDDGIVVTVDDILGSEAYKNSTSKQDYFLEVNYIDVEID